ncbi:unnamed protein product [Parnassius apollo]|uniref:(apollo) hypothetical protein n=1 Tax=Parnassius apollo TaxID=110799 RepID=A0A8S3Y6T8_PARAO|nr:unnamed protein product [Parnassius apollo]
MKHAMVNSALGDDVYGEDPTVNALESKVAILLGKQAALFVPSGTMANLIAVMVHCNKRGSEAFVGNLSHIYKYEQGGASFLGGVLLSTLENKPDGTFDLAELEHRIRGGDLHEAVSCMVAIENTHNVCGGKVLPQEWVDKLGELCARRGLALHMDGARLLNASTYAGESPARLVQPCDSVSLCFSKGLSAPVGSVLVAIQGLFLKTFSVDVEGQHTNIVLVRISSSSRLTADVVLQRLAQVCLAETQGDCKTPNDEGVIVKAVCFNSKTIRFTLHHDITDEDLWLAIMKIVYVFKELEAANPLN